MVRGVLFISLLLGLAYVAYLQTKNVEEQHLQKNNDAEQTTEQINQMLNDINKNRENSFNEALQ